VVTGELIDVEDARPGDRLIVPGRSRPIDVATLRREQIVGGRPMVVLIPVMVPPEGRPVPVEVPVGTKVRRVPVADA
jgi:hypothetical protein